MLKQKKKRSRKFKDTSRIIDMEQARRERRNKRAAAAAKPKNNRTNSARTEARAAKKVKRRLIYTAIFLVMIAVICVTAYNLISLKMQERELKDEYKVLQKQKSKLEYELSQIDTPEYVEQQARQMLRMIKPGEILYVFPKDENKTTTNSGIVPEEGQK